MQEVVGELLKARGLTLAVAESSTGGLVGHLLTEVPGSSAYFLGGVVAYANEPKTTILGVPPEIIERYGVVSRETTLAMARGIRRLFGSDLGLAVNGIAGPSPGRRSTKPVGLTYLALAAADAERWEEHVFPGERHENKEQAARAALRLLVTFLEGEP